jgi:hypothetical protein
MQRGLARDAREVGVNSDSRNPCQALAGEDHGP